MIKLSNSFITTLFAIVFMSYPMAVKADTVDARCDVFPKGEDKAISSGLCTFSQRQGYIGIQLANGNRYDLQPVGDEPANYQDQNGKPVSRENMEDKRLILRLSDISIFVYWDTSPYKSNNNN